MDSDRIIIPSPPAIDTPDELAEALQESTVEEIQVSARAMPAQGFIPSLTAILEKNIANITTPKTSTLISLGVFIGLWTWLGTSHLTGITAILIFFTGSYNNFIAKLFVFMGFQQIVIPLFSNNEEENFMKQLSVFRKGYKLMRYSIKHTSKRGSTIIIIAAGWGIFISNFLTRNNKFDKYFVCIMISLLLLKAVGSKRKNNLFVLIRGLLLDISKLIKVKREDFEAYLHLSLSGFSLGLMLSYFIPFLGATNWHDPKGYYVGVTVMIVGFVMRILIKEEEVNDND